MDTNKMVDWIPYVSGAFGIIAVLIWFFVLAYIYYKTKIWEFFWPFRIHTRHNRFAFPSAIVIAFLLIMLSLIIANIFLKGDDKSNLITSPGLIAAVAGVIFTIWTFLTTLIIRSQQQESISDIPQLLDSLIDTLGKKHLLATSERVGARKSTKRNNGNSELANHSIYIMDYAPGIGIMSQDNRYSAFVAELTDACKLPNIEVHAVFFPKDKIRTFHESMGAKEEKIDSVITTVNELDQNSNNAVWASSDIGELHVFIIDKIAFQYIVIPKEDQKSSQAFGFKTEDVFVIEYLKDTVKSCMRKSITPKAKKEDHDILLTFNPQDNIKCVHIQLCDDPTFPERGIKKIPPIDWSLGEQKNGKHNIFIVQSLEKSKRNMATNNGLPNNGKQKEIFTITDDIIADVADNIDSLKYMRARLEKSETGTKSPFSYSVKVEDTANSVGDERIAQIV